VGPLALSCPHVGPRAAGERVRVGLRPEEVRIRGLQPGAPNTLPVTVELLDFLGSFWRATLRPQQVPDIALRSDFSHNAMRDLGIREGQTITVALPPESLRVFACKAKA
jgi:iron(III) transport system ATP-binding protein